MQNGAGSSERGAARTDPVTGRNPVVLVHGIMATSRKMRWIAKHLEREGWETHSVDLLPCWGQLGIDELADQLKCFVDRAIPEGQPFDIVAFSMGGLISRYYLQRLGGLARVQRFISISAPHNGSLLAWLLPNAGCRHMRPGSAFLRALEADVRNLDRIQFTSFWTPLDLCVFPGNSSVLPAGENRRVWCLAHPLMVWERRIILQIEALLARRLTGAAGTA